MVSLLFAALLAIQTPPQPASPPPAQAEGEDGLQAVADIFKVMGACERNFSPEQVRGVRRSIDPAPGQAQSPLQVYLAQAYDAGKADRSWSAPMCQQAMQALSENQSQGR